MANYGTYNALQTYDRYDYLLLFLFLIIVFLFAKNKTTYYAQDT